MAKSLRSKTKRAFRKIKREDPKSDYHIRDKLRLQRLNEKLKVLTPVSDDDDEDDVEDETVAGPPASSMEEDGKSKQGDPQHRVHDGCSEGDTLQQQQDTSMTQLCWIAGMLDPDAITLACSDGRPCTHVDNELCQRCDHAGVVDLLQYSCTTC